MKTVVIEGGNEVGGLCILRGCMPSKALLYAAEVLHLARNADTWGLKVKSAGFNFTKVMQRKAKMIAGFADYRREQLQHGRFKFIRAHAKFLDPHTLELNSHTPSADVRRRNGVVLQESASSRRRLQSGDGAAVERTQRLTARYFIIATGSVIAAPPLPSLEEVGYLTSDHALSLKKLPKSMIVLGGGAIACELAQFFARFDVRVTMIQRSPHILKEFDEDAAKVIETVFRREGIRLFTGTRLVEVNHAGKQKVVGFEHAGQIMRVQADEILFALGRTPNTASLALDRARVQTEQGRIVTNARMQTSARHIFAAGDCTGPHEIVHLAIQQAEVAAHNLAHPRTPRTVDYRLLTSVVFTDPQVATVGLTEKVALARKVPFLVASYPFNDHGKSLIMEALDGFVKLLVDPKSGEVLGGACVGPMGGELIHEINTAMAKRMTVQELATTPHYHPTLAEIWTYPAEELADKMPAMK